MIKLPLLVLFCTWPFLTQSQTNDPAKLRAIFISQWKPFRIANDVLYDFTPICVELAKNGVVSVGSRAFWGTVKQVLDDGLLVNAGGNGTLIHLRHHPEENTVLDGSRIHIVAIGCGRYRYENTTGSGSTVPDFDCGKLLTLPCAFTNKTMVYGSETVDVPITPLDLKAFDLIVSTNKAHP